MSHYITDFKKYLKTVFRYAWLPFYFTYPETGSLGFMGLRSGIKRFKKRC